MILTGNSWITQGEAEDIPQVLSLLRDKGINTEANPDLSIRTYSTFGIDDAQELSLRSFSRASGNERVFVIACSVITTEAQNALLKTLEEPRADALFFFLVPTPYTLLRTILSRVQVVTLPVSSTTKADSLVDIKLFLASSPSSRIELLKPLLEKTDDDVYNTPIILSFFSHLEQYVSNIADTAIRASVLRPLYTARQYATDRGALVKTLLESLALLLPVIQ
ncbi:MAG: polymerase subunit delta, polymerase subunit delta protein [Candidatus Kaiserbacteria bacterium]|nr:polymerase subunit delta, polymerase subunit delta protein [Candidatus Kaiserbacteria bacterium]